MIHFLTKLYKMMPNFMQNLGISLYGLYWNNRRFGGIFEEKLNEYELRDFYSWKEWTEFQNKELEKIILYAWDHVPFYKKKFQEAGLKKSDFGNIDLSNIGQFPMLEKNELRQFGTSDLMAVNFDKNGHYYASSGSTGTPTSIYFSKRFHQNWSAAFEVRIRYWAGLNRNSARGMIGGRRVVPEGNNNGPFYRYNSVEKQVYFSAYHINKENASNYLEGIKKYGVEYMTGYAMSNYFLARIFDENKLKAPKLKAVITSSEKLTPEMREVFERVYSCKTYDSYSGVEACGLISECEHGSLHISPDVGLIEILDSNGRPVNPGETGEAVCTGFLNYDQPLIRYRIGDLLTLSPNQNCACKRNMPIISEINGRIEDTVIGKDGREMVRFHGIFVGIESIIEGQIIQHELDKFEIKIVSTKGLLDNELKLIQDRMKSQLGDVEVQILRVETIERNNNGKFKAVISHVKRT